MIPCSFHTQVLVFSVFIIMQSWIFLNIPLWFLLSPMSYVELFKQNANFKKFIFSLINFISLFPCLPFCFSSTDLGKGACSFAKSHLEGTRAPSTFLSAFPSKQSPFPDHPAPPAQALRNLYPQALPPQLSGHGVLISASDFPFWWSLLFFSFNLSPSTNSFPQNTKMSFFSQL